METSAPISPHHTPALFTNSECCGGRWRTHKAGHRVFGSDRRRRKMPWRAMTEPSSVQRACFWPASFALTATLAPGVTFCGSPSRLLTARCFRCLASPIGVRNN